MPSAPSAGLPRITLVLSEEPGEEALVWAATPGDPLVEALRWALERDRPVFLVDPDLRYEGRHHDRLPDPHVLWSLEPGSCARLLRELGERAPAGADDVLREAGMAHHLKAARSALGGPLVGFVGAAHAARVAEACGGPTAEPLARRRRTEVSIHHLHPDSLTVLLSDPPLAHAVWDRLRTGGVPAEPALERAVSRRVELEREGLRLIAGQSAADDAERRTALVDWAAARAARPGPDGRPAVDRMRLGRSIWEVAARSWTEQTREQPAPWQRRMFDGFARRCARIQGRLVPSLYDWTVAARGVADDNLAWEVFDALRSYPWQTATADDLSVVKVDGEVLDLGVRTVRFRRRFFRVKSRPVLIPVRRRPGPEEAERWLDGFESGFLCSYPPRTWWSRTTAAS